MGDELESSHRAWLFKNYPAVHVLYVCIQEFREIFRTRRQSLMCGFIVKCVYRSFNNLILLKFTRPINRIRKLPQRKVEAFALVEQNPRQPRPGVRLEFFAIFT